MLLSVRRVLALVTLTAAAGLAACDTEAPRHSSTAGFTFENGLAPWSGFAIDVSGPDAWTIEASDVQAFRGDSAVLLRLVNGDAPSTIWMQVPLLLLPQRTYDAVVEFELGTADAAGTTPFELLTGFSPIDPSEETEGLLLGETLETTGGTAGGYTWRHVVFEQEVQTGANGQVFLFVGIIGTTAAEREYFIDDLQVTLVARR